MIERLGGPDPREITLVADGPGQENGAPVRARVILTCSDGALSITRLTGRVGAPMLPRDAYGLMLRR